MEWRIHYSSDFSQYGVLKRLYCETVSINHYDFRPVYSNNMLTCKVTTSEDSQNYFLNILFKNGYKVYCLQLFYSVSDQDLFFISNSLFEWPGLYFVGDRVYS